MAVDGQRRIRLVRLQHGLHCLTRRGQCRIVKCAIWKCGRKTCRDQKNIAFA